MSRMGAGTASTGRAIGICGRTKSALWCHHILVRKLAYYSVLIRMDMDADGAARGAGGAAARRILAYCGLLLHDPVLQQSLRWFNFHTSSLSHRTACGGGNRNGKQAAGVAYVVASDDASDDAEGSRIVYHVWLDGSYYTLPRKIHKIFSSRAHKGHHC